MRVGFTDGEVSWIHTIWRPDDIKLLSSATLFAAVTPAGSVFEQLLKKYHGGQRDDLTLQALRNQGESL